MHIACLVLIVVGNKVEIYYPQFHYSVILKLKAICTYMSLIIYAKKILDEGSDNMINNMCISSDMGTRKQWITIEIYAFFINLTVLIIFLLYSRWNPKYLSYVEFKDKKETIFKRIDQVYQNIQETNKEEDFKILSFD